MQQTDGAVANAIMLVLLAVQETSSIITYVTNFDGAGWKNTRAVHCKISAVLAEQPQEGQAQPNQATSGELSSSAMTNLELGRFTATVTVAKAAGSQTFLLFKLYKVGNRHSLCGCSTSRSAEDSILSRFEM
jgi:hypothetical protein